MNTLPEPTNDIEQLIENALQELTNLVFDNPQTTRVRFPCKDDKPRYCEQELRQILIEKIREHNESQDNPIYYSVETPSDNKYQYDNKKKEDSVSVDLTLYNNKLGYKRDDDYECDGDIIKSKKRLCHIELKEGDNPDVEKDFVRLHTEKSINFNYFIHYIVRGSGPESNQLKNSIDNILKKYKEKMQGLNSDFIIYLLVVNKTGADIFKIKSNELYSLGVNKEPAVISIESPTTIIENEDNGTSRKIQLNIETNLIYETAIKIKNMLNSNQTEQILFPVNPRNNYEPRYSEQEIKQLFISTLPKDITYSVETPTADKYTFSEKDNSKRIKSHPGVYDNNPPPRKRCGSIDLSLYNSKITHFEFKYGDEFLSKKNKGYDVEKDLLKLAKETEKDKDKKGYFVHCLFSDEIESTKNSYVKKIKDLINKSEPFKNNNISYLNEHSSAFQNVNIILILINKENTNCLEVVKTTLEKIKNQQNNENDLWEPIYLPKNS